MEHAKQNINPKLTIARTIDKHAYITLMAVLIIFPVILQTVINLRMLSIGGIEGGYE